MKALMGLTLLLLMACGSTRKWKAVQAEQQELLAQTLVFQQQQAQVLHRFSMMDSLYQKERLVIYPQGEISWDNQGFKGVAKQIVWEQTKAGKSVQAGQTLATLQQQQVASSKLEAQSKSQVQQTDKQRKTPRLLLLGSAVVLMCVMYLLWRYWRWKL